MSVALVCMTIDPEDNVTANNSALRVMQGEFYIGDNCHTF